MARKTKEKIYAVPVLGYFLHLIEAFVRLPRNDNRVRELRGRVLSLERSVNHFDYSDDITGQSGTADRHLPALLNAIETVPALSHEILRTRREIESLQDEICKLQQRVEFLQKEFIKEGESRV